MTPEETHPEHAQPTPPGAWFVHRGGQAGYPMGLYADELSALRAVVSQGYGRAVYWPFGIDWTDLDG